jgi:hypothetical protein
MLLSSRAVLLAEGGHLHSERPPIRSTAVSRAAPGIGAGVIF